MALLEADCEWLRERRQRAELLPSPARDVVISLLDLVENLTLRLALALADAALTKPAPMAREVDHVRAGLSVEIDALKMRVTEVEKRTVDHAARDGLSALKGRIDEVRVDIGCLNDRAGALEEQVDKRFNDLAARVEDVEAKIDWRK